MSAPIHHYESLGRYLACAFIAHRQGIRIGTLERSMIVNDPGPIGDYWVALAKVVEDDQISAIDRLMKRKDPGSVQ